MLAFPSMLFNAARDAGMAYPDDADDSIDQQKSMYPHFHVFCALQLGRRMTVGTHYLNAKILMCFTEEQVKYAYYAHFYFASFDFCGELSETDFSIDSIEQAKKDLVEWGILEKVETIVKGIFDSVKLVEPVNHEN